MTYLELYQRIMQSPGASYWLKNAARSLADRDPVDAERDAVTLLQLATTRAAEVVDAAPLPNGLRIFTPFIAEGCKVRGLPMFSKGDSRVKLSLSPIDHAKIGRGGPWEATVTDVDSGRVFYVRGASCGSPGCFCAAEIYGEVR